MKKYTKFPFQWHDLAVRFVETSHVVEWVECDVYEFIEDKEKDLWIIRISKNSKTPHQLILRWEATIEWYISWKGMFIHETWDCKKEYVVGNTDEFEIIVNKWDKVQWISDQDSELIAYEVCYPPYEEWRFQNL